MTTDINTLIRFLCRGPNARTRWKFIYRKLRVYRREALKANMDMTLYGTGAVFIPGNGGDPYRVHPKDIILEEIVDNVT